MPRLLPVLALAVLRLATPAQAQQIVAPVVAGTLHAVNGERVDGVRVIASCGEFRDSTVADSTGRFSIQLACPRRPVLEMVDTAGRFYPAIPQLRARQRLGELDLLLIPRRWRIGTGTHAGSVVELDVSAATARPCRDCSAFFLREDGDTLRSLSPGISAWLEHSLPLRVAFDHEEGAPITARDSVAFMRVAEALEADLGRRWFQPATLKDIFEVPDGDPFGSIIVSIDPLLSSAGRGNWAGSAGEILAGIVYLQSSRLIHAPESAGIVAHEIMHTLGFGHTCSWRSVMAHSECPSRRADAPTADDVAHAQLLIRLRTLERKFGIFGTVPAALAGERKYRAGAAAVQEAGPPR